MSTKIFGIQMAQTYVNEKTSGLTLRRRHADLQKAKIS